ncbi:MAG: ketoacyl-ACP synthase III [Chloroflexaceae bacterium]|nr:ketoacyl-ACP synthase III [Chloroflexaceae bacterium]
MEHYAAIIGWGMSVPRRVVTNDELARQIDTSNEWIRSRTGIGERRIASADEYTSVLATAASQQAIERAGIAPEAIDLVILATSTPDRPFPATASVIQAQLGIPRAGAFDVVAACSGFVYGLHIANSMIQSGAHQTILLVAADLFSHILNWHDRNTCVLFGDGAGAVVLQQRDQPLGLLSAVLGSAGEYESLMLIERGGTRQPLSAENSHLQDRYFSMHGREVFKHAIREMALSSQQAIEEAGLQPDAINLIIPHQANLRIIEVLIKRLEIPFKRVFVNLERYGNTSAASVPIALCEAVEQGQLHDGDHVLLTSFGGGFTWASAVVRWGR